MKRQNGETTGYSDNQRGCIILTHPPIYFLINHFRNNSIIFEAA